MSLPKGYKRLEYIQSSGTQSIDTLFNPKGTTRVVLDAMVLSAQTSEGHLCSVVDSGSGPFFTLYYDASAYGTRYGTGSAQKISGVTGNSVRHVFDKNKNTTTIDGANLLTVAAETFTCAKTLPLFCRKPGSGGTDAYIKMQLYSCQIYDNGTLVRDFIPCQNASGAVGLWDAVNEVFYGNAGTGTFTAGPVVPEIVDESEITELEYIESSGTQYVNSGFYPTGKTRAVVDFKMVNQAGEQQGIFGSRPGTSGRFTVFTGTSAARLQVDYNTQFGLANSESTISGLNVNERTLLDVSSRLSVNGVKINEVSAVSFTSAYTMYLFANNNAGTAQLPGSMVLYAFQIYDNGLLERDYIPAMLGNGEVGLYDRVFQEFYCNAGTGEFIAGPPANTVDITPTMTSNTAPAGYVASQSSAHNGLNAWYAFDGVDSTSSNPNPIWHSTAGMPQWVMLQFPEAVKVTFFSIKNRGDVDATYKQYGPKAFELQGSHNGADFVPLGAYTSDGALGATGLYRVQNPGRYQYYRVYVTEAGYVYNNQQYAVVDQIRFYEPVSLVPDAPQNFRVDAEADALVTLAWDAVSDAVGYRLYRSGQLLADTEETSVSVAVEPFAGAVFTVTAYNEYGEGAGATLTYFKVPDDPILFLITDRTQQDVTERNSKGYYAASDLNRVGYAVEYLAGRLKESGVTVTVSPVLTWTDMDWGTPTAMKAYLADVQTMRGALKLAESTPTVPEDMEKLTYTEANQIEMILLALDTHIKNMLMTLDAGWAVGLAYTGLYAKEAYR